MQPGLAVEVAGGFVGEQDPRPRDERAGDRHALLFAAGQLARQVVQALAQADLRQQGACGIAAGERVAIVGESGSGKTTLLSLLAGLDVPSHGEVWLDGQPIHASNEDARAALRAEAVGFVFQNFQLMPAMSALDNVALPLELRGEPGGAAARALLERVGLGARLHHLPRQLSGGEQQRVAIARAFVAAPRILFADEPTGNLDRKTGLHIEDLLFDMDADRRTTVVVVTHDERLAARCDRQLRLDAGRLLP